MTISLNFKSACYTFSKKAYKRYIVSLIKDVLPDNAKYFHVSFSYSSESVYVLVKLKDSKGYVIFAIKGHKMLSPTSIKTFNSTDYVNRIEFKAEIEKYLIEVNKGKYPLVVFKYRDYMILSAIYKLKNSGVEVVTSEQSYVDGILGRLDFHIEEVGYETIDLDSFHSSFRKLAYAGVVRGYNKSQDKVGFYITDIGKRILKDLNTIFSDRLDSDKYFKELTSVGDKNSIY